MLKNLTKSRNFKRARALVLTLILGFSINSAISFASGDTQRTAASYIIPKDTPKPKTAASYIIPKDTPKP